MLDLGEIREKIDGIDKQLVSLFEERMALCHSVAEYKISTGKKVLDTERENAKLAAITKMVQNPENVHAINDLFSQIMANSRKMQYRLLEENGQTLREPYEAVDEVDKTNCKVVYQGVPGAYSYIAHFDCFHGIAPCRHMKIFYIFTKVTLHGAMPWKQSKWARQIMRCFRLKIQQPGLWQVFMIYCRNIITILLQKLISR